MSVGNGLQKRLLADAKPTLAKLRRELAILLWQAIKRFASNGFDRLHLGRTSLVNEGLRRFKLGFGAQEERIEYYKYDFVKQTFVSEIDNSTGWFNWAFRRMPLPMLQLAGEVLYPHLS
jgi:hypothetical protein